MKVCVCLCVGGLCAHPCHFAGCTRAPQVWSTEGAVLGSCPALVRFSCSCSLLVPGIGVQESAFPAQGRDGSCCRGKSAQHFRKPQQRSSKGFLGTFLWPWKSISTCSNKTGAWMPMWALHVCGSDGLGGFLTWLTAS